MAKTQIPVADLEGRWRRDDGKEATITIGSLGEVDFKGVEFQDWSFERFSTAYGIAHYTREPKKGPEGQETKEINQVNLPNWAKLAALDSGKLRWRLLLDFESGHDYKTRDNCDIRFQGALVPGFVVAHPDTQTVDIEPPVEASTVKDAKKGKGAIDVVEHKHVRFMVPAIAEWLTAGWADESAASAAFAGTGYGDLCAKSTIEGVGSFGVAAGVSSSLAGLGTAVLSPLIDAALGLGEIQGLAARAAKELVKNVALDGIIKQSIGWETSAKVILGTFCKPLTNLIFKVSVRGVAEKALMAAGGVAVEITKREIGELSDYFSEQCRFKIWSAAPSKLDKTPVSLVTGIVDTSLGTADLVIQTHQHRIPGSIDPQRRICPGSLLATSLSGLPDESRARSFGGKIKALCTVREAGTLLEK